MDIYLIAFLKFNKVVIEKKDLGLFSYLLNLLDKKYSTDELLSGKVLVKGILE